MSIDLYQQVTGHPKAGCGTPTHVIGTNGGMMPCGALLTRFGRTEPYYCALCVQTGTAESNTTTRRF